jgi:hypothetical protein
MTDRLILTEYVCDDCIEGDHESCRRSGGWPHQETCERCGCHLSAHALDNRNHPTSTGACANG